MTIQQVEQVVFRLPEREQLRLARSILDRVLSRDAKTADNTIELALQATFGIWADRDDMPKDGVEYVRSLRDGERMDRLMEMRDDYR